MISQVLPNRYTMLSLHKLSFTVLLVDAPINSTKIDSLESTTTATSTNLDFSVIARPATEHVTSLQPQDMALTNVGMQEQSEVPEVSVENFRCHCGQVCYR